MNLNVSEIINKVNMILKNRLNWVLKFCLLTLFLSNTTAWGQFLKTSSLADNQESNLLNKAKKSEVRTTACSGFFEATDPAQSFLVSFKHIGRVNKFSDEINQIKVEKTRKKKASTLPQYDLKSRTANTPKVGKNFEGNIFNGGAPPDNTIAISENGIIVSAVNANVAYYNTNGSLLWYGSFWDIFKDPSLTEIIYDPIVMYDAQEDKFIFIAIHGFTSEKSKVLIAFSKTNNPVEGWYTYSLSGNPFNNACWLDFPKLGISNNEVFITGNLFNDFTGFNEAVIYQITKNDGFAGLPLEWIIWSDIPDIISTIIPASYGQDGNYGPGLFFVCQSPGSGNAVNLIEISNDLSNNPQLLEKEIFKGEYGPSGFAQQLGTDVELITGDCRILNAFYLNGIIHYVFQSEFGSSNLTAVNYNRLNVATLSNTSYLFSKPNTDCAFPSVASYAIEPTDKTVAICYLNSNATIYPETRVVVCNDAGAWSNDVVVKRGNNFVDAFAFEGFVRWGDYSGITYKKNLTTPEVWLSGCYGSTQTLFSTNYKCFETWIAQITDSDITTSVEETQYNNLNGIKVYPNPITDIFKIEFNVQDFTNVSINIYDISGKSVVVLFNGNLKKGLNLFSFNKSALEKGIYMLSVQDSSGKKLQTARILVE